MPHSPISRTEGGSVSAIKNFLFGGVLDPSCPLPAGAEGEGGRPGKAQLFSVQILRSQVFRPQVLRSQIVKTRIHKCDYNTVTIDDHFPNNLRSEPTHAHSPPPLRPPLPKVNNVTSSPSLHRPPATAAPLTVESKELPQYASTPNLSCDLHEGGTGGYRGAGAAGTGTLPRNLHLARTQRFLPAVFTAAPLPSSSSSSSSSSSCLQTANTTLDSGFQSDAAATDTDSQLQPDPGGRLPPGVHEYRRASWDVTPSARASRRKGKQVSSVILKIEKGLFATAAKDSACDKPPCGRDRRPLDHSAAPLPLPLPPSSPPPPPPTSTEEEGGEEEAAAGWATAAVTPGATFLARCVKIHDLSNHEGGDDSRDGGSPRHPPERRESGRFPSAARLLRSLGRSARDNTSGSGAQGRDSSDARLSRANPSYHSEGKGLKKKNNWTSERELNTSLSPAQKERSHSFCEKSNSASKRRYSYHDNKTLREESRGRQERQENGQGGSSTLASPAPSHDLPTTPSLTPISSQPPISASAVTPPLTPSPITSSSPSLTSSSSTTPTLPKSVSSQPPSPISTSTTENIYENLPPRQGKSDAASERERGAGDSVHGRVLERGERERRSSRKLTKDSGYETSPYSESDYANLDLYAEVGALGEGDGDDVTLAPESELASPPSPSAPHHQDAPTTAVPLPPRPATHPARMSHDSLERRCSWQEQSSQDALGDASVSSVEGRSATPSPRLERAAHGAVFEAHNSFIRNLCGRSSRRSPLPRYSSAESLSSFAESLVSPGSTCSGAASSLVPAKSTPSLHQDAIHGPLPARNPAVNAALLVSRSTPNLDDPDDGDSSSNSMVTKSSMYSYLHGASTSTSSKGGSGAANGRYWDPTMGSDDMPDREDYAHHLRSSSYQMLHSRQLSALSSGSAGSYSHSRQHSNASNYSEPDDLSPRGDLHHHSATHGHHHHHGMDRARFFSYDNLGPDASSSSSQKYHVAWNVSEPDLTLAPPPYSPPGPGFQQVVGPPVSPKVTSPAPATSPSSPTSTSTTATRHPASPPPPPVRDASSLKYIKYGPGHEKYPSWPVPAANQVLTLAPAAHDANVSGLPDSPPQSSTPQGSHRSKSWTEQSEYPKEKAAGYARPYTNKKPANNPPTFQRQLKTVVERTEKNPKEMFHSGALRDDVFTPNSSNSSNYSFMDAYYKPSSAPYYPLYDREGRALNDKDYSIPSPPERDLAVGEASLGQVTAAQLEEYVRRYEEFGYTDLIGTTPLLDQLRRESEMWEGGSERDSGRGESESVAESARYSNGRESVTTVVTNSSSASSSETLKWHGSLSDISIMSGHSRDPRADQNIAHSARVQAPQRHNSESVLYYGPEGRAKGSGGSRHAHDTREHHRRPHPADPGYPRHPREGGKWSREVVERNNEMNNLKKFPSYSYTQPLSQITESPTAEMRETPRSPTRSPQSPTIDFSKPPTVAERIHELERQSRTAGPESVSRWPRDQSGSREREQQDPRKMWDDSALQDPRETMEKSEARSSREPSEIRTHQRRGSRDSQRGDRDLRLDFSNTSSRKGDISIPGVDGLRSPTSANVSVSSSRSPTQRDAENRSFIHENFQNILNSFTEGASDRPGGVSYSYLDPEKRRKVPDTTLKSIQKQAVMSFYERHAGRNLGAGTDVSSSGSQSSLTSSQSAPETPQGKWAAASHASQSQNLRTDKSGRAGKGVARLGRVPETEDDQPLRPGRRRSSGRLDSSSELSAEDTSRGGSQRSSLASEAASSRAEQPPALPQKMGLQSHPEGAIRTSPTTPPAPAAPEDTTTPATTPPGEDQPPQDVSEDDSGVPSHASASHDTLSTQQLEAPRPPSLPPSLPSDPPPRPPERPPKKPTLRSLFHGPNPDAATQNTANAAAETSSDRTASEGDARRLEDSGAESRNLSPGRPYYYRKPPAPDPPKSPPAPPCPPQQPLPATPPSPKLSRSPATLPHASSPHAAHLVPPTSAASRSSTPDLPPPPPPPIPDGEVLISDEPLPPPPTNLEVVTPLEVPPLPPESPPRERLLGTPPPVPRENGKNLPGPQTYHKDSYMAHRRDWKTGFEGRYRRTISPSGSSRNLHSSTTTTQDPPHPASPTATTTTSIVGQNEAASEHDNIANENGWGGSGHARNGSTTVSFTAEELRAFKARRAHAQDASAHTPDKEHPSRKLHSSQSSPSLSSSALHSVASEGSTSSLASGGTGSSLGSGRSVGSVCSGGVSPVSPCKLSPAHSWRTSLESLNRANSTTVSSSVSNGTGTSHSPRTITRATSLADPLHAEEVGMPGRATQDSFQLPRTASINESLSRITAISDSLSRSTSVADSLAGQSFTTETHSQGNNNMDTLLPGQSAEPPSLPLAPASPTSPVAHDGPVTARPATVTEEAASPVSPSIKAAQVSPLSLAAKSPTSPKSTSATIHPLTTLVSQSSSSATTTSTASEGMHSSPAVCPASTDASSPSDVVVLGYGRTPNPEELECDRLSKDYVPQFPMDNKMRALFAPGPEHKTTAHYMEGVFTLELRKEFICGSHARHPDLVQVGLSRTAAPKPVSQSNAETSNGVDMSHDRTPLPADSAYFTSESKAKMLTRLRGSSGNLHESLTDQQLIKKKEELVASIGRKLEILRAEHEAIKDEQRTNAELGAEVTCRVEAMARLAEAEKYKLHVEEIDKITSLLLGLSGRLARAENALKMVDNGDAEEKRILENKRDKLRDQLEEAKKLKENIDRRAVQVSKVLNKYLTEDQYADYDHFIKMKAKLIMDAREIDDKIKLGEEQQKALRETLLKRQ